jgi:hypothetical protein
MTVEHPPDYEIVDELARKFVGIFTFPLIGESFNSGL